MTLYGLCVVFQPAIISMFVLGKEENDVASPLFTSVDDASRFAIDNSLITLEALRVKILNVNLGDEFSIPEEEKQIDNYTYKGVVVVEYTGTGRYDYTYTDVNEYLKKLAN